MGKRKLETLVVRISNSVPRPGLEPGWIAPLVFETSASTHSAIWAFCGHKITASVLIDQIFCPLFCFKHFFSHSFGFIREKIVMFAQ